jgi:hypothetical protein
MEGFVPLTGQMRESLLHLANGMHAIVVNINHQELVSRLPFHLRILRALVR